MLVVKSLDALLAKAEQLVPPASRDPGPRIGVSFDFDWWLFRSRYGRDPDMGVGGYWSGLKVGCF